MEQRKARLLPTGLWLLAMGAPWAALAEPASVTIARADCRRLVEHVPAPDIAYEPGVDARGRRVAPADLDGGTPLVLPETIEIPIDVELQERFGIPSNPNLFKADAVIGKVTVNAADGRASFDGQPLQDEAQAELTRRCQEILYGRRPRPYVISPPD